MKKNQIIWSEYYDKGGVVDLNIPKKIRDVIYDADGNRKITPEAIKVLTEYSNSLPQTKELNTDPTTSDYTKDRQKLHVAIINDLKDDLVCIDNKEPIAILMGGSPASGKSTFLRKYAPYLLKDEILKVDADEIRAKLPEYKSRSISKRRSTRK